MKFLILLLLALPAHALEIGYGMGESSFSTDREQLSACTIAENKAHQDALIKFSSQQFSVQNQMVCHDTRQHAYCDYMREVDSSASGTVRGVIDRVQHVRNNTCFVEVKVQIEPAQQLLASVESNRIYAPGDQIDIKIDVGQPLYLYIFSLHDHGVDMLFPNKYDTNSLIDDRFVCPGEEVEMTAMLNGKNESKETLLFLFTKNRQDLAVDHVTKDTLKEVFASIPVSSKKVIQQHIIIRNRR